MSKIFKEQGETACSRTPKDRADDEYFILGDNRLISKDSRYFGPIKESDLMGEVVFRIWPFSGFGSV